MKNNYIPILIAGLTLVSAGFAEWTLVDNFENGLGDWQFSNRLGGVEFQDEPDGSHAILERPFDDAGGHVLAVSEGLAFNNYYFAWLEVGPLPTSNPYTVYMERARFDLTGGSGWGLTALPPDQIAGFDENEVWFEMGWQPYTVVMRDGRTGLNIRNGDRYEEAFSQGQAETWYQFWYVINPVLLTWDVYVKGGQYAEQTLVAENYDWRTFTADPNLTFVWQSTGNDSTASSTGEPNYLDNFFVDTTGENLTVPEVGDTGGSLWAGVAADPDTGAKETGIGWIIDEQYPFIVHYSTGGWMYVYEHFSTLESIILYDYNSGHFYWTADNYGGWHFDFSDPSYGAGGWADWTP